MESILLTIIAVELAFLILIAFTVKPTAPVSKPSVRSEMSEQDRREQQRYMDDIAALMNYTGDEDSSQSNAEK